MQRRGTAPARTKGPLKVTRSDGTVELVTAHKARDQARQVLADERQRDLRDLRGANPTGLDRHPPP